MRLLITLTIITLTFGCQKQREQIEKFVFDNKQIAIQEIHKYEFDSSGRIKTDYSTTFMYMSGVPFDSSNYVKRYQYNDKGQVTRIFDTLDSTLQTKFYNNVDSLVADYKINNHGDTVRMTVINYSDNKSHKKIERILLITRLENFKNLTKENIREYDTLLFITDFTYNGDKHVKSVSFDKDGAITDEVEIVYDNDTHTKSITYAFLGDKKFIKETSSYTPNETIGQDAVTIGTQGDTISYTKSILQDENKVTISYHGQFNMKDITYYDKAGRMIGNIMLDLNEKTKVVSSYTYDNNGNLIEYSNYRERLNNAR